MSDIKFTKGEWEATNVKINDLDVDCSYGVSVGGFHLATVSSGATFGVIGEIQKANAHLIAAAPNGFELGELVIKMCDHHEGLSPTEVGILYEAATAFIKKARGES